MPKRVKTKAILISDIHYNLQTLELADESLRTAVNLANALEVPLIIAGDLHDTKANLRGECVNALIKTLKRCTVPCFVLRGNHDSLNEKSSEHVLNFLSEKIKVIAGRPYYDLALNIYLIPYYHDPEELKKELKDIPKGATLVMHQGCSDANSGEYIQDKSALPKECFKDFRVISGHYHTRQDIKCGRPQKNAVGLFSYIGNPYTLNYAEATDPEKGFRKLLEDGTLDFVPTNLRKHVIIEAEEGARHYTSHPEEGDLVWVKARGTKEWLAKLNKAKLKKLMGLDIDFKLSLIPNQATLDEVDANKTVKMSKEEILDDICDTVDYSKEGKSRLKALWRQLYG